MQLQPLRPVCFGAEPSKRWPALIRYTASAWLKGGFTACSSQRCCLSPLALALLRAAAALDASYGPLCGGASHCSMAVFLVMTAQECVHLSSLFINEHACTHAPAAMIVTSHGRLQMPADMAMRAGHHAAIMIAYACLLATVVYAFRVCNLAILCPAEIRLCMFALRWAWTMYMLLEEWRAACCRLGVAPESRTDVWNHRSIVVGHRSAVVGKVYIDGSRTKICT